MRFAKGHKDSSHARILKVASRNIRRHGIAAAGMTGIMAEAGLTNGGFYSHFESKNDLVRQGLERALDEQLQHLAEADVAPGELNQQIRSYLSPAHRDRPDTGCASAALLPEISRQPRSVRKAYTARIREIIRQVTRRLPLDQANAASQDAAIGVFAVLVGTLQLARAVDDRSLSDEVLAAGIRAATTLAGVAGEEQGHGDDSI
jgi:TetR/AcrR family transcriptional regulator, transcriptional repressor for nem operon